LRRAPVRTAVRLAAATALAAGSGMAKAEGVNIQTGTLPPPGISPPPVDVTLPAFAGPLATHLDDPVPGGFLDAPDHHITLGTLDDANTLHLIPPVDTPLKALLRTLLTPPGAKPGTFRADETISVDTNTLPFRSGIPAEALNLGYSLTLNPEYTLPGLPKVQLDATRDLYGNGQVQLHLSVPTEALSGR
jgi:hypothetical protein